MRSETNTECHSSVTPIAIIGMACRYPGAHNLRELWENILARRQQFRQMPRQRLAADYFETAPDSVYCNRCAVLDGFTFDPIKRRIPKGTVESTDIVHWLALEVAIEAFQHAGAERLTAYLERSGVVVGNTLTGEQTRAQSLRLRWPFFERILRVGAESSGLSSWEVDQLAAKTEKYFKSMFAPITDDSLAGGMPNVIAGRICNFLDFKGGGYVVDGACASSLIAVATAATMLRDGDLDVALAGGVDVSLDPFELVGFAKMKALAQGEMAVFDRRAGGFIPGEGCGFVVMKRLEDARRDGDAVHAVLHGWGISSDGKGGITTPVASGQSRALRRAYERAPYTLNEIDFIEGHGTGTAVGDAVELDGIQMAMADVKEAELRSCGLTSLKSIVGHTKAAAGIGGLIKAAIAVNRRVIPPTAGCSDPHPKLNENTSLYVVRSGETRDSGDLLRAGVTGAGFGGINCHVTLESADPPSRELEPSLEERILMASNQLTELFLISADSPGALRERLSQIRQQVDGASVAELCDLAAMLAQKAAPEEKWRCALVVRSPDGASTGLHELEQLAQQLPHGHFSIDGRNGTTIYIGKGQPGCRVGMLFPGQGSQQLNMARMLVERHGWAREVVERTAKWLLDSKVDPAHEFMFRPVERATGQQQINEWFEQLTRTEVAQPAITLDSLLWYEHLQRLGIEPIAVGGHSLGELMAFHAAGAFDARDLMHMAAFRGRSMTKGRERGAMLSLRCQQATAEMLIEFAHGYVEVANVNSDSQTVVSGEESAIKDLLRVAAARGVQARQIAVSNAFHSKLVASAAKCLREGSPIPQLMGRPQLKLFSGVDGSQVNEHLNLHEYFSQQVMSPVNFVALLDAMARECDVLIEVGPGRVLSSLARENLGSHGIPCYPTESQAGNDEDLNRLLAELFVRGVAINSDYLYSNRLVRPFVAASDRKFIANLCEKPLSTADSSASARTDYYLDSTTSDVPPEPKRNASAVLLHFVSRATGFPVNSLRLDQRLLHDLNLDSFKSSALIADTAKSLGIPGKVDPIELAGSTLHEIADALEQMASIRSARLDRSRESLSLDSSRLLETPTDITKQLGMGGRASRETFGDPRQTWVHSFCLDLMAEELSSSSISVTTETWRGRNVLIVCSSRHSPVAASIQAVLDGRCEHVEITTFDELQDATCGETRTSDLIAILPASSNESTATDDALRRSIESLQSVLSVRLGSAERGDPSLSFVQFTGGSLMLGSEVATCDSQVPLIGLATSLHRERPRTKVRVLDFDPDISPSFVAATIERVCPSDKEFVVGGYDSAGRRRVPFPRLIKAVEYHDRTHSLSPEDLVLVTGGAKGITAECALALARATSCRTALVGSSDHLAESCANHDECTIQNTLLRFAQEGLVCHYYRCDVANGSAVHEVLNRIRREQGEITAVVHGAGRNTPRLSDRVSAAEAFQEISPKVLGARHILGELDGGRLKLVVGMSSIIGVTGMAGNAWYAFSNQLLDQTLELYARQHPDTDFLSIGFSAWGEIGMAARMQVLEHLERSGVAAISTEAGVGEFLRLLRSDPGCRRIIVTSKTSGLNVWQPQPDELPFPSRFIETIITYVPEVELLSRAHLTIEKDRYLEDHKWRGSFLLPAVFGLEAMAQAVAYVSGKSDFRQLRIKDISLPRPIVVDAETGSTIQIHAKVEQPESGVKRVRVSLSAESSDFAFDHCGATFILEEEKEAKCREKPVNCATTLDILPAEDLYGWLLFQGPRFQRISKVLALNSHQCLFKSGRRHPAWSSGKVRKDATDGPWILGDPYFRDSLLQSGQLIVSQDLCLPVYIEELHICDTPGDELDIACRATLLDRTQQQIRSSVYAVSEEGALLEGFEGVVYRVLEHHEEFPTAEDLASTPKYSQEFQDSLEHCAAQLGLQVPAASMTFHTGLSIAAKPERHRIEASEVRRLLARITGRAMSPNDFEVYWDEKGKPHVNGFSNRAIDISFSHEGSALICSAGEWPQGIDIAAIVPRGFEDWLSLLGRHRESLLRELIGFQDHVDRAGSRVWATIEAARKSGINGQLTIQIESSDGDAIVFRTSDGGPKQCRILTFPIVLTRVGPVIIALAVAPADSKQTSPENEPAVARPRTDA